MLESETLRTSEKSATVQRKSVALSQNSDVGNITKFQWRNIIFIPFNFYWKSVVGLATTFSVFSSIYDFVYEYTDPSFTFTTFLVICSLIYAADTILSTMHRQWKSVQVTKVYLPKSSFLLTIDFITLIPLGLFYEFIVINKEGHSENVSNALKIINVLRAYRLKSLFSDEGNILGSHQVVVLIGSHLLLQSLLTNLFSALWYKLGCWENCGANDKTWTINLREKFFDIDNHWSRFMWSFFFVTGVYSHNWNYDIRAETDTERWAVLFMMFIGVAHTFCFLYGELIALMLKTNKRRFNFVHNMKLIERCVQNWDASPELQKRTFDYYEAFWERRSAVKDASFFHILPVALQKEVSVDIFWDALTHSHLFSKMEIPFKRTLSLQMKSEFLLPGQFIYTYGSLKSKMVYIVTGVVQILSDEDFESPIVSFSSGTLLGEIATLVPIPSTANVKCASYCEMHTLDIFGLFDALKLYPKKTKLLRKQILERIRSSIFVKERAQLFANNSSELEARLSDTNVVQSDWLKERYRRSYAKEMDEYGTEYMNNEDEGYWRAVGEKAPHETVQHTSKYVDLYSFSDEVELLTDIVCLRTDFPWILEPNSGFLKYWELLMMITVLTVCMTFPYCIVFTKDFSGHFSIVLYVGTFLYILDVWFQCTTAIKTKDIIIINMCAITRYRLKQITFLIDILSVIPFYAFLSFGGLPRYVAVTGCFNYLLRVYKLFSFMQQLEKKIWVNVSAVRMIKYLFLYALVTYWMAALLFLTACYQPVCDPTSWYAIGQRNVPQMYTSDFMLTLFFSFDVLTGLLDTYYPQNMYDVAVCTMAILLSSVIFSLCYSELTSTWLMQTKSRTTYQGLISEMKRFSKEHKFGRELDRRIEWFLVFQWNHSYGAHMTLETNLLSEAPENLSEEIIDTKIIELLKTIPFFQDVNPDFLNMAVKVARCHALPPKARIVIPNLCPSSLIIVRRGYCKVRSQLLGDVADNPMFIAGPGSHFPIIEFLQRIPSFVGVEALTCCEVVSFDYLDLIHTMQMFATVFKEVQNVLQDPAMDMRSVKCVPNVTSNIRFRTIKDTDDDKTFVTKTGELIDEAKILQWKQYLEPFDNLGKFRFIRFLLLRSALDPEGRFTKCWEIGRAFFAVLTLIVAPTVYCTLAPYVYVRYFSYALDCTAYVDVIVRLNVGYYTSDGIVVTHPLYTATHYITHAFFIDLIACFPFQLIPIHVLFGFTSGVTVFHYWLIISRSFQVYRFVGLCKYLESDIRRSDQYIKIFRLFILLLIGWHYMANILPFYTCRYNFNPEFVGIQCPEDTWLFQSPFNERVNDPFIAYILSFYYIASIFTLAVTDVFNVTENDRLFITIICAVLYMIRILFFASISSMRLAGNINLTSYRERMWSFVSFLRNEDTSEGLIQEAIDHYEYDWSRTRGTNVYNVFKKFHTALHEDVTAELYNATLKCVEIFRNADEVFFRSLSRHVCVIYLKPGAVIIKNNQFEDTIYVVNSGRVDVHSSGDNNRVAILYKGSLFGNLDRHKSPARFTAIAKYQVELLAIPNTLFHSLIHNNETISAAYSAVVGDHPGYIISRTTETAEEEEKRHNLHSRSKSVTIISKIYRTLLTKEMTLYKVWSIFVDVIASCVSVVTVLYNIGLQSRDIAMPILIYSFDLLFLLKIYIGFHTAYNDSSTGLLVNNLRLIAKKYLRLWFWIDLVSVLPIDLLAYFAPDPNTQYTMLLWMKTNRVLRLIYVFQFFFVQLRRVNVSNYLRLAEAAVWSTLTIQLMSCFHLMLSCSDGACWYRETIFSTALKPTTSNTSAAVVAQCYVFIMFVGLGFEEVYPREIEEVLFSSVCAVLFQFVSAFTISYIANFMEIANLSKSNYELEVMMLDDFLKARDLSPNLLQKTITYTIQLWLRAKGEWLPVLLQIAPTYLREELMNSLYSHHLRQNTLFLGAHDDFLSQLTAQFDRCVLFPGDFIVERGDVDGNMYFIHDGQVEVVHRNKYFVETIIEVVHRNEVFSVAQGLYKNKPHVHIYRAKTVIDLLILNLNKAQQVFNIFPSAQSNIYGIAEEVEFTL